jgi:hypothetical protein
MRSLIAPLLLRALAAAVSKEMSTQMPLAASQHFTMGTRAESITSVRRAAPFEVSSVARRAMLPLVPTTPQHTMSQSLLGSTRPSARLPNTSTLAAGKVATTTEFTAARARPAMATSLGVGLIKAQKSRISSCRLISGDWEGGEKKLGAPGAAGAGEGEAAASKEEAGVCNRKRESTRARAPCQGTSCEARLPPRGGCTTPLPARTLGGGLGSTSSRPRLRPPPPPPPPPPKTPPLPVISKGGRRQIPFASSELAAMLVLQEKDFKAGLFLFFFCFFFCAAAGGAGQPS